MANYCTVDEIKGEMDITLPDSDALIMGWIEAASGIIDKFCDRHFDLRIAETRYFDGAGSILFLDDLILVTTLDLDEDGDGGYESPMVPADYVLYPLNTTPKLWAEISSSSNYGGFASGVKKGVRIVGNWGYSVVPGAIHQACIIQVCRWHKRKDSGYATAILGSSETGTIPLYSELDPDVKLIINKYRRHGF